LDAQTFADWHVDYVKVDGCNSDPRDMDKGYPLFGYFLNITNRPMVYSCEWPFYQLGKHIQPNYTQIAKYCNTWRSHNDIQDSWPSFAEVTEWHAEHQDQLIPVQGPGAWNDPDMLIIGNFGLSYGQSQAQMALWSIMAAPLIMSTDLRTIDPAYKHILLNKNMIAINQDKLGVMGRRIGGIDRVQIWSKPLAGNLTAFVFYHIDPFGMPVRVSISLADLDLNPTIPYNFFESFSGKLLGQYNQTTNFETYVNPSGSVFAFWVEPIQSSTSHVEKIKLHKSY
jgi:alpha-N-acetylgalactosaminidase